MNIQIQATGCNNKMKPINEVGIVIPYYHNELTELEKIAFSQCVKILGKYPIILLVPEHIKEGYPKEQGLVIEKGPDKWLYSVSSYNQMMLNIEFYKRFEKYRFILLYQLDAFVFSDKLQEMCALGYDYIGAPWLYGHFHYVNARKCIWRVGNGGFSLRKVGSFIRFLEKNGEIDSQSNEDFSYAISDSEDLKIAPLRVALQFAFEREVRKCFRLNGEKIPFGCHAWEKYDFNFWKPYIESQGYKVDTLACYTENEDRTLEDLYGKMRDISFFWENIYSEEFLQDALLKLFWKQVDSYIIWGAGYRGRLLCKMLRDARLPVKYIIDSDITLKGKYVEGYKVINSLECNIDQTGVIIAVGKYRAEVAERLNQKGLIYRRDYIMLNDIIPIIDIM